ncbi:MAG: hypothetical protein D6785_01600, partial [Planctomycetota bacterium]
MKEKQNRCEKFWKNNGWPEENHLRECSFCREEMEFLQKFQTILSTPPSIPFDLEERIHKYIEEKT